MVFVIDIEKATIENEDYRRVLYTTKQNQLVLMSIPPQDDIPCETHDDITQFIRVEKGEGIAYINKNLYKLTDGISLDIPAGTKHQIINTSDQPLKLYTIYSPAEHPSGLVQKTNPAKNIFSKNKNKNKIIYLLLL